MAKGAKFDKQKTLTLMVSLLREGGTRGGILSKVGKTCQCSVRTLDRILKEATQIHMQESAQLQKAELEGLTEARKKEAMEGVLSSLERKKILSEIARGKVLVKKPVVTKFGVEEIDCEPDHGDRKAAIAELNKMDGDYAPVKSKQEITIDKPVIIDWNGTA
jgi:hypothetical protein